MVNILVVEDDKELNKILIDTLNDNKFNATGVFDGKQALEVLDEKQIDLILSDIMMPVMDGFELAINVRMFDKQIPFLFMTAKDDFESKKKGFNIGIDDYIVKPFDMEELLLRIGAILRRANIYTSKKLQIGNFTMNEEEHLATYNGVEIVMTVKEFQLLFKLLSSPNKTFTRSQLMDEFWDYDSSATSRTIDVHMANIREKTAGIKEFEIKTIHGLGYKAVINEE